MHWQKMSCFYSTPEIMNKIFRRLQLHLLNYLTDLFLTYVGPQWRHEHCQKIEKHHLPVTEKKDRCSEVGAIQNRHQGQKFRTGTHCENNSYTQVTYAMCLK